MHGHSKTSVKEQIQLTKGFIAAEKENHRSILAGSILHLHNESQLGENSLARGIKVASPDSHSAAADAYYEAGDETMSWRGGQRK